jgi:hypothetical protein
VNRGRPRGHARDGASVEALPPLSAQRAFVVQFRSGSEPGGFAGRVEHMPFAQATHFGSVEELLAFLTRVLAETRD